MTPARGMAQALGVRLLDSAGRDLELGGAALSRLNRIDMSGLNDAVQSCEFLVACDVNNPLTGPTGASAIYGPQKGATSEMIERLDAALLHFAEVVRRDIGVEINDIPGSGAAGGLGGGMLAFTNGELRAGVDIVLDTVRLDDYLTGCNLVITGEGSMDHSTIYNKAPVGVAERAKRLGIPVVGISGSLGAGFQDVHEHGIDALAAITAGPMTLDEASERAAELIANATEQVLRFMKAGSRVFGSG